MSKRRRETFLTTALTWEGVPWRKVGTRREGVNCLGLLVGIARECDFLQDFVAVGESWANFPRPPWRGAMLQKAKEYLEPITVREAVPGDLLLFRIGSEPQHITVLTGLQPMTILHSQEASGKVKNSIVEPGMILTMAFKIREFDK